MVIVHNIDLKGSIFEECDKQQHFGNNNLLS